MMALSAAVLLAGCGPRWPGDGLGVAACPAGLLPGELVITEIMASPRDGGAEWIEIYNAASAPVDLRGVVITVAADGETSPQRHVIGKARIEPGAYFVLGERAQPAVPVDHVYGDALGPLPEGGRVTLRCDVIEVDAVAYPAAAPGVAVGVSGALAPDAAANDEPTSWCVATAVFTSGLTGSPGARNEVCAVAPGDAPPDSCEEDGALRAIVAPAIGDLVITEVMANPEAVPDAQGEWLELYVARDVDLNGLAVSAEPGAADLADAVFGDTACVRAAAGTHLVLAASMDPAANGGLAPIAELAANLRNTGGTLAIGRGQSVLDAIAWASAPAGASLALDPAHRSPVDNDLAEHWCASEAMPYGSGDSGTPGVDNAPCSQPPPDGPDEPGDPTDAGPGDPPAGMCDDAGVLRPIMTPAPGTVRITEIMADPAAAPDASGEWIELAFGAAADLNGLELGKTPGQVLATIASPQCLPVPAGTHVILARSADITTNGGLPRVDAALGFALVNGGDTLFIGAAGAVLDTVTRGAATAGVSTSLDEADGVTWCPSPEASTYGAGDRGTPGAPNPACTAP